MKLNLQEEIANAMGGNFSDPQVGEPGPIAGMSVPLGCPTPTTKKNCMPATQAANKKEQERRSKLVAILLGNPLETKDLTE